MNQIAREDAVIRVRALCFVSMTTCLSFVAKDAIAAVDFSLLPKAEFGMRTTDNLRTSIDDREAAWGFDIGGGVQINVDSATLRSRVTPSFNFRRFAIGEGADADEYEVRTSTQWGVAANATVALDFDYIRDSTLSTELTDAGRQTAVSNRDTINVAPSIALTLTEHSSATIGFLYSDVRFEELRGTPFADYDFKQANGSFSHSLTHWLDLFTNAYISEFRTPSRGSKSLTYGGMAGAAFRYSGTLEGDFSVGYVQSEIDFQTSEFQFRLAIDPSTGLPTLVPVLITVDANTTEHGPLARVNFRKQWSPTTRGEFSYARSVSPTVFGAQTSSDDILLVIRRQFTDKLSAAFRGGYNIRVAESDAIATPVGNLNLDQSLLAASVRYRLNANMAVSANYRFIRNDLTDLDERSYNNSLFIIFSYSGEPHFYRGF